MKKNLLVTALFTTSVLLVGCQSKNKTDHASEDHKLNIVTSFYPMYEFTKEVTGDKANISMLIPSSVEPHDWEPAAKDLEQIQKSDALVFNNENMETWVDEVKNTVDSKDLTIVDASKDIKLLPFSAEEQEGEEHAHEEHKHEFDPHLWLSPKMAIKEVKNIANNLAKADPENKQVYLDNEKNYVEKLEKLDQEYAKALANVKNKEIITQHAAFGYLADSYGLKQVPIAGLSPDNEPSAKKIKELKEFAKKHNINTIFFEENASSKVAETLANELHAKTAVLDTLEGLSEKDQKNGETYITIMEKNLKVLQEALN